MKFDILFEKFSALLFLLLLVGMVAFLVFIPMPPTSEKVVLTNSRWSYDYSWSITKIIWF